MTDWINHSVIDEAVCRKAPATLDLLILYLIGFLDSCLKVPWHEIFLFQNMLPIDTFIKVAFLFLKFSQEIWLQSQVSKKLVPETGAWISLLL